MQCLPEGYHHTSWFVEFEIIGSGFKEQTVNRTFQSRLLFSIKRGVLFTFIVDSLLKAEVQTVSICTLTLYGEKADEAGTVSDLKQNQ